MAVVLKDFKEPGIFPSSRMPSGGAFVTERVGRRDAPGSITFAPRKGPRAARRPLMRGVAVNSTAPSRKRHLATGAGNTPVNWTRQSHEQNGLPAKQRQERRCFEARLYGLLRQLSPSARLAVIAGRLSEAQRLALERWILVHRPRPTSLEAASTASTSQAPSSEPQAGRRKRKSAASQPKQASAVKRSRHSSTERKRSWSSGRRGIHRRFYAGRLWYRASVSAGPFHMQSRYDVSLDKVLDFHEVLDAIRARVMSSYRGDDESALIASQEDAFRKAIDEEPHAHGVGSAAEMGLCFTGRIAAKHWIGRALETPNFRASRLEEGLKALRRLAEARGAVFCGRSNRHTILRHNSPNELAAAWMKLREVFLDICAESGRGRWRTSEQLMALEERHRAALSRAASRTEPRAAGNERLAICAGEAASEESHAILSSTAVPVASHSPADAGPRVMQCSTSAEMPNRALVGEATSTAGLCMPVSAVATEVSKKSKCECKIEALLLRWSPQSSGGSRIKRY